MRLTKGTWDRVYELAQHHLEPYEFIEFVEWAKEKMRNDALVEKLMGTFEPRDLNKHIITHFRDQEEVWVGIHDDSVYRAWLEPQNGLKATVYHLDRSDKALDACIDTTDFHDFYNYMALRKHMRWFAIKPSFLTDPFEEIRSLLEKAAGKQISAREASFYKNYLDEMETNNRLYQAMRGAEDDNEI